MSLFSIIMVLRIQASQQGFISCEAALEIGRGNRAARARRRNRGLHRLERQEDPQRFFDRCHGLHGAVEVLPALRRADGY